MAAMLGGVMIAYDPWLFALSVMLAIVRANAALFVWSRANAPVAGDAAGSGLTLDWRKVAGASFVALAVSAMHYTAIEAAYFFATAEPEIEVVALGSGALAYLVLPSTAAVVVILYAATLIGKQLEVAARIAAAQSALVDAIETISDGFVIFDSKGKLSMTNSVFREMNKEMGDMLTPGTSYENFLLAWARLQDTLPMSRRPRISFVSRS